MGCDDSSLSYTNHPTACFLGPGLPSFRPFIQLSSPGGSVWWFVNGMLGPTHVICKSMKCHVAWAHVPGPILPPLNQGKEQRVPACFQGMLAMPKSGRQGKWGPLGSSQAEIPGVMDKPGRAPINLEALKTRAHFTNDLYVHRSIAAACQRVYSHHLLLISPNSVPPNRSDIPWTPIRAAENHKHLQANSHFFPIPLREREHMGDEGSHFATWNSACSPAT